MTILAAAADVLRCYGRGCAELTVTDLVARLGVPKSNASRLLRAMRDVGLLETVGKTKRYRPGVLLVDVARTYRRSSSLIQRADAVVARVSGRCGHTGYVSILNGAEVSAITDHPGTHSLRVVSTIGRQLPAFASATGRSLLARLPVERVQNLYAQGLSPPTPQSPKSLDDLLSRLSVIRRTGYALSFEEANPGVAAVAAAVGDPETGETVSLCIAFPAATSGEEERRTIAEALLAGAQEIAAITGDRLMPAPPLAEPEHDA